MPELYTTTRTFDARRVYEIWLLIVQDERLYDAMMRGEHVAVGRSLGFGDIDLDILEDFARQPGTRWHVENLRYRATMMVSRLLNWHLPATMRLLTDGVSDWQRDLVFEYLTLHRWIEFGHHRRFAECRRFASFVEGRVLKRRRPPEHIAEVMSFERNALDLLERASRLPVAEWETPRSSEVVRRGIVQALVPLRADVLDWVRAPRGPLKVSSARGTNALLFVASPERDVDVEALDEEALALLEAARQPSSLAQLERRHAAAAPLLKRWLDAGILVRA